MNITLNPSALKRRTAPSGFTLVEMLVVIGIMTVIVGIIAVAVPRMYTYAIRNSMQQNIQLIRGALEQYKGDHGSYPPINYADTQLMAANYPGAVVLCWALIAPGNTTQDGHGTGQPTAATDSSAPGFTKVPNGQVYGPYLNADKFKILVDTGMYSSGTIAVTATTEPGWYLADRYSHPILYFRANEFANVNGPNGYAAQVGPVSGGPPPSPPMYNLADNPGSSTGPALIWAADGSASNALIRFQLMLGDLNCNGQIDPGEMPVKAPYLLWSAGPDEVFGVDLTKGNSVGASLVPSCDDATSFTQ